MKEKVSSPPAPPFRLRQGTGPIYPYLSLPRRKLPPKAPLLWPSTIWESPPDTVAVNRCPFLSYPAWPPPSFQLLSSLPTQQRQQQWGSQDHQAHALCCHQIPCETEGRLSPSFQSMNSDPPHSGTDTAVDLEAGLTHSLLPTNTPFCLGLAKRGSLGEEGWKRLRIPEFTRPPGHPLGSTTTCGRYPHPLHLEVGWQVRALKQTLGLSPNPDLEGTKDVGAPRMWEHQEGGVCLPRFSYACQVPRLPLTPTTPLNFPYHRWGARGTGGHWESLLGDGRTPALASSCAFTVVLRALF